MYKEWLLEWRMFMAAQVMAASLYFSCLLGCVAAKL